MSSVLAEARMITVLLRVTVLLPISLAFGQDLETLGVCEALQQLDSLNGKVVAIRGERFANDHGRWLLAPGRRCPSELRTGEHVWPNSIYLSEAEAKKLDFNSLAAAEVWIEGQTSDPRGEKYSIVITYIGRLQTRQLLVARQPDGTLIGNGYGAGAGSPAKLTYHAARGAVVKKRTSIDRSPK